MTNDIKFKLALESNRNMNNSIMYLYGDILDDSNETTEVITPAGVRKLLEQVTTDNITIHLNSYGGSVFASIAICNMLKDSKKNITCVIDGIAASGASLIAVSCNSLKMPENTMLMIHRASTLGFGNAKDFQKIANTLADIDKTTVITTLMTKFNKSEKELFKLLDAETWLSAQRAFELGLCDEVLTDEDKNGEKTESADNKAIENFIRGFLKLKVKGEMINNANL